MKGQVLKWGLKMIYIYIRLKWDQGLTQENGMENPQQSFVRLTPPPPLVPTQETKDTILVFIPKI